MALGKREREGVYRPSGSVPSDSELRWISDLRRAQNGGGISANRIALCLLLCHGSWHRTAHAALTCSQKRGEAWPTAQSTSHHTYPV